MLEDDGSNDSLSFVSSLGSEENLCVSNDGDES